MKVEIIGKEDSHVLYGKLLSSVDGASENDAKVILMLIAQSDGGIIDTDIHAAEIINALGITESEFNTSIAYWRGAKVLKLSKSGAGSRSAGTHIPPDSSGKKPEPKDEKKEFPADDRFLSYTESEMAEKIAEKPELKTVVDECQQIFGKIFAPSDVAVIVGMSEKLGLSGEYIIMFFAYCAGIGKKTLRYVEKTVYSFYDEGIDSADKLAKYIEKKENCHKESVIVRKMLGCADRELSSKESKLLNRWLDEYNYSSDIIRKAFEIAADRGIKGSYFPYMGAILDSWYKQGYRTAEDIEKMIAEYEKSREESSFGFDTDEFFDKAVAKTKRKRESKNNDKEL